ncbi:Clp protease N-terminal domain-containing protein [Thermogemmatispora carboxidivorans]|uniref:Clp protease N-terminal domain-containing protein n=1 Tax=Thermogemmatispora carboxidivorans TaxID=1382306 RepID=UPI000699B5BD|nr:Clp protease N-terminal domain-containing protein [Thermogemmatispora carboxidivorans]
MTKNRFHHFTESARLIFVEAQQSAERYQQTYIAPEHLLLGVANSKATTATRLLNRVEIDPLLLRAVTERAIADQLAAHPDSASDRLGLTPEAKEAIELAVEEASREQLGFVGSEHLLLALLRQQGTLVVNVLEQFGVNLETARARLQRLRQEGYTSEP